MIIKQVPEDFVVEEMTTIIPDETGAYTYFWLKKRDYTTIRALQVAAGRLHMPLKNMGYAGNKDKNAITTQLCSVKSNKKIKITHADTLDITCTFFGYGKKPVSLGDLYGNKFHITVRDVSEEKIRPPTHIINYFDEQRFSTDNCTIARALITRDFKGASHLIAQGNGDYNHAVRAYLELHPSDYVGALRNIPKKILTLFISSYQSWVWNETAAACIAPHMSRVVKYSLGTFIFSDDVENKKIPLVGFGTEMTDNDTAPIIQDILKKENITLRDFIIRELPELSAEGGERDLVVDVKDFTISMGNDELNPGKKKAIISFVLPKGSYGTIVVKSLFRS